MLDEEARAGWELFEVLDSSRIRLKRATSWRDKDNDLTQDPYRTRVVGANTAVVMAIVGGVLGIALLVGLLLLIKN